MPKINKPEIYIPDTTLSRDDNWVGTDAQDFKRTKTFTAGALLDYIMENYSGTEQNNFFIEKALGVIDESVDDALIDAINGLDAYTVSANQLALFTGEFSSNDLNKKFVYILQTGKGNYGVNGTQITIDDLILLNPIQPQTIQNTSDIEGLLNNIFDGNGIINAGVIWISGLTFEVWATAFTINGITYFEDVRGQVTLSDADATDARIDVFYIEKLNEDTPATIGVLEGLPNPSPLKPSLDLSTQVESGFKLLLNNVTEGATPDFIYNENEGTPNEFNAQFGVSGAGSNLNYTDDYYKDTTSIKLTMVSNSGSVEFSNGGVDLQTTVDSHLIIAMKRIGDWGSNPQDKKLTVNLYLDAVFVGYYTVPSGALPYRGFNSTSTDWQLLDLQLSNFTIASGNDYTFDAIHLVYSDFADILIDNVKIEGDIITGDTTFIPTRTSHITNDGPNGVDPFITALDVPPSTRIVDATVTGTYDLDHSLADDWKLTLTGDTTISDTNLPTGTDTIEFTIKLTGAFTPTFPAYWDVLGDAYDGAVWNFIAVQIHDGNSGTEEVTAFITNM